MVQKRLYRFLSFIRLYANLLAHFYQVFTDFIEAEVFS